MLRAERCNASGTYCLKKSEAETTATKAAKYTAAGHNAHQERHLPLISVPGEIRALLTEDRLSMPPARLRAAIRGITLPDGFKVATLLDSGTEQANTFRNGLERLHKDHLKAAVAVTRPSPLLNGGAYAFGNTEEALKYRVLGTRARGHAAAGKFNHADGSGYVAPHAGDYRDAINNRKATVHLLTHEATMGSMSPYAARRLRRLARDASDNGTDGTDYTRSYTARSFVPHFAQRISTACVMEGAKGILTGRPQEEPCTPPPRPGDGVRSRGEGRERAPYHATQIELLTLTVAVHSHRSLSCDRSHRTYIHSHASAETDAGADGGATIGLDGVHGRVVRWPTEFALA